MRFIPALITVALLIGAAPVMAQDTAATETELFQSQILTIDLEALFEGSTFRNTFDDAYQTAAETLQAENIRIEEALTAEERSLAERRATMEVETFRSQAEAFAAKVDEIRAAQDAKEAELTSMINSARQAFINAASPILAEMMRERSAVVILDRRTVFLTRSIVDITDAAIERINAEIGAGEELLSTPQ